MRISTPCVGCGVIFDYEKAGRGRRRKYCSKTCKPRNSTYRKMTVGERREFNLKNRKVTCAACSNPMFSGTGSLPQGQAICRDCRGWATSAAERKAAQVWRNAARAEQRAKSRPSRVKLKTTERGYGAAHKRARLKLLAQLVPGTPCGLCGDPMVLGQPLDLDHSDPSSRLRGEPGDRLTHRSCNRRESAVRNAALRREARRELREVS